jgi:hypothetical protein
MTPTSEKKEKLKNFVVKHQTKITCGVFAAVGVGILVHACKGNRYPYGSAAKPSENLYDLFYVVVDPKKVADFKPRLMDLCSEFGIPENGLS